jgi:mannose/fructose/N-acetylgalactosamine-specific phosphotransferase system component IID
VAAVLFGLFCWSTHRFSQVEGSEQQAKVTQQIQRLDSLFQGLAGGTLVLVLLWMLRL